MLSHYENKLSDVSCPRSRHEPTPEERHDVLGSMLSNIFSLLLTRCKKNLCLPLASSNSRVYCFFEKGRSLPEWSSCVEEGGLI
jgi:hypothetical protein